jgi:hypothetical protein
MQEKIAVKCPGCGRWQASISQKRKKCVFCGKSINIGCGCILRRPVPAEIPVDKFITTLNEKR